MGSFQPLPGAVQLAAAGQSSAGGHSAAAGAQPGAAGARPVATAAHPPPGHADGTERGAAAPADAAGGETARALVPSPWPKGDQEAEPEFGAVVARLPVEMDVAVPVRQFRVRHLLALEPGAVIESQWNHGNDLPLTAGDVRLGWTEFEVIEMQLAVRLTRLV